MAISTILSSYNGSKFIKQQIDSILNQDVGIHELVIVDDCSSDDSIKIIREIMSTDHRIILLENKKNIGTNKSLEIALKHTTGDIIFFSDQDDLWLPNKTKLFLAEFQSTGKSVIYSDALVIKGSDIICDSELKYHGHNSFFTNPIGIAFSNCFPGHNMMATREYAISLLPFPDVSFYDHWIAVNASLDAEIGLINKKLLLHRIHQANQVNNLFQTKESKSKKTKKARSKAGLYEIFSLIKRKSNQDSLEYKLANSATSFRQGCHFSIYNTAVLILCLKHMNIFFPNLSRLKAIRKSHNLAKGILPRITQEK